MNEPLVSIIIPAKNAARTIEKCINSVLSLDYPNYEVIVVNDNSTDETVALLEKNAPKIRVISNPESLGPSGSRNIAAREARGEYLAFTDADCIVDKGWIKELVKGFLDFPEAVSCGGEQDIPADATEFEQKVFEVFKKTGFVADYTRREGSGKITEVDHNASCTVIYKKDVFLEEGGFLGGLWPGEDVELDHRLRKKGHKIFFNPAAKVYHYRPEDVRSFLRMMYKYGMAQGFLIRKYGFFRKIHLIPPVTILAVILFFLSLFSGALKVFLTFAGAVLVLLLAYFGFDLYMFIMVLKGFVCWNAGVFEGFIKRSTGN